MVDLGERMYALAYLACDVCTPKAPWLVAVFRGALKLILCVVQSRRLKLTPKVHKL